jgi:hypothetical protein
MYYMADKLDWLGRHLVLIRYLSVADVCAKEGYKISPNLEDLFTGAGGAEDMVFKLAGLEKYQNACDLMVYMAHRRAAVWWAYRCVCSINEELRQNPPAEFDIENPPKPPPLPSYFNIEVPKPDPALTASMDAALAGAKGESAKSAALVNPAMKKYIAGGVEEAFLAFEKTNGVHPMALLKQLGERLKLDPYAIDPDSPIFRMEKELTEKLDKQRAETVAKIKSQFIAAGIPSPLVKNPKLEAHQKMLQGSALASVYRWVAAPDAENSQKCLDIGNECANTPAGLLALSAFWAYGNLLPMGEQTVPTPPGLMANGLTKVLLLCALQQGGTRKTEERYKEYFRLGVDVLTGKDNWEASLAEGRMPHEEISAGNPGQAAPSAAVPPGAASSARGNEAPPAGPAAAPAGDTPAAPSYRRWKPNGDVV